MIAHRPIAGKFTNGSPLGTATGVAATRPEQALRRGPRGRPRPRRARRRGRRYQIMFDAGEMAVFTRVGMALETKDLVAELPNLVQAAGLGARNHVTETARTVRALQQTLAKQADYLKLPHPRLTSENAVALMRAANAGERNRS